LAIVILFPFKVASPYGFNLTAGAFSILGNVLLMALFVDLARMNYLLANLATIAVCSVCNFAVSDRFVFQDSVCERR